MLLNNVFYSIKARMQVPIMYGIPKYVSPRNSYTLNRSFFIQLQMTHITYFYFLNQYFKKHIISSFLNQCITERIENEISFNANKVPRHAYKWHHLKKLLAKLNIYNKNIFVFCRESFLSFCHLFLTHTGILFSFILF